MEKEIEFLRFIYLNAEMGVIGINDILNNIDDKEFCAKLKIQKEEYNNILNSAKELLKEKNADIVENSKLDKLRSSLYVKYNCNKENKASIYAKMMMEGTNKGIIAINEKINNFNVDDKNILKLANKLLELEENNIEEWKKFL